MIYILYIFIFIVLIVYFFIFFLILTSYLFYNTNNVILAYGGSEPQSSGT
jgi:hypothetical protein